VERAEAEAIYDADRDVDVEVLLRGMSAVWSAQGQVFPGFGGLLNPKSVGTPFGAWVL
jgi:hypothetical protein